MVEIVEEKFDSPGAAERCPGEETEEGQDNDASVRLGVMRRLLQTSHELMNVAVPVRRFRSLTK